VSVSGKFLNQENIIKKVFDETNNALRTTSTIVAPGGLEVNLSAASGDSVLISDGADNLAINSDGSINARVGDLVISHLEDSIQLGDGTNLITSTTVGPKIALDVNIVNNTGVVSNTYAEVTSVPSNTLTSILTKTITVNSIIKNADISGSNVAEYTIVLNSQVIAKKRSYFGGDLNINFDFNQGLTLTTGDVLVIKVIHSRPFVGDFNSNILLVEG
jgi:hypothetical protein